MVHTGRHTTTPCLPARIRRASNSAAMTSKVGLLLSWKPAAARPTRVPPAATPGMGKTSVVDDAWDGRKFPTDLQLGNLLRSFNAGKKLPAFVHRANAYSAAPEDLVKGRQHAPGTGDGREGSCYFYSEPAPGKGRKGNRQVAGGKWHPEVGQRDVRSADGKSVVAYKTKFSYKIAMETTSRGQGTGWIMVEISVNKQGDGADHMVLCLVYKSKRKYPDKSMAAGSSTGEEAAPEPDDELGLPGGGISSPAPVPAALKPAPFIGTAVTTNLLLQKAAEKAASWDFERACEIHEFLHAKELFLTTIDEVRLDRSIVSGLLGKLEVLLQHVAIIKKLDPAARDGVVSCGDDMSTTICSTYLNVAGDRLQQDFNTLGRIGFNVHDQVSERSSKVEAVLMVVRDSEGKEYTRELYSASAPVRDDVKRKADDDNHPEAPPAVRQVQRTDTDDRSSVVEETERTTFPDDDKAGNLTGLFKDDGDAGVPQVQPEQPLSVADYGYVVHNGHGIEGGDLNGGVPEVQPQQQVLPVPEVGEGSGVPEAVQPQQQALAEVGDAERNLSDFYDTIGQVDIRPANVDPGNGLADEANLIALPELFWNNDLMHVNEAEDGIEAVLKEFSPNELLGPSGDM